jgi:hypothetical protein
VRSGASAAVGVALILAAPASALTPSPSLITKRNTAVPELGNGRVYWASDRGRRTAIRRSLNGGHHDRVYHVSEPKRRGAFASITELSASRRVLAFTVVTGHGRGRHSRFTRDELLAGPIGGPYVRLSGFRGREGACAVDRLDPGRVQPGRVAVDGTAVAYNEVVTDCSRGERWLVERLVVRDTPASPPRVLATCRRPDSTPTNDDLLLAGDYLAWVPDASGCPPLEGLRLFRWRSGKLVYTLRGRDFMEPLALRNDGVVVGQFQERDFNHNGVYDDGGHLTVYRPRAHPRRRMLPRIGAYVDAVELVGRRLVVEYEPYGNSRRSRLAVTDLHARRLRDFAHGLSAEYPWIDFDGSRAAWATGPDATLVYTTRLPL